MKRTAIALALLASLPAWPALAQTTPSASTTPPATEAQRISALEARIAALETELRALRAAAATPAGAVIGSTPVVTANAGAPANAAASASAGDELEALAADASDTASPAAAPAAANAGVPTAPGATEASFLAASADTGSTGGATGANAFNPAISLLLNGSLARHSLDPDAFERSGFPLAGEAGPGARGFSLGESELSFAANIDDKFYGQLTLAIESEDGEDHLGVEEAYIDTTSLPHGLAVRAGRFFSNIGYLNGHHAHTDSFFDRPLAYQAFLGNQYGDDGVQARWVAPTSTFLEVGGEVFRGQSYPSGGAQRNGLGTRTLFAHAGGDAGVENEWLAGISMLKARTAGGEDGFEGDATLYIADATWKWAPQGNFKDGGITLRSEFLVDDRDGAYLADPEDAGSALPWKGMRRGGYVEAVYRLNRSWDIGYRYDRLWADDAGPFASAFDPYRHSVEATWRNSEFSLLRLQLSREKPNPFATDNAVVLQYQTSLGAHGAHKF